MNSVRADLILNCSVVVQPNMDFRDSMDSRLGGVRFS